MKRKTAPVKGIILVVLALLLAACSSKTPTASATVDANLVYTQAALTVQAGIAMTSAARPSATATVQPSDTPVPTNTAQSDQGQPVPGQAQPTATLAQPGTGQALPTNTPLVNLLPTATTAAAAPPAQSSGDKCEWVDQSPKDGSLVKKNASWDTTIVIKNSGTSTWDKTYALKFWGGDRLGSPADFYLQNSVKPGEMYRFQFSMTAPGSTGKKQANWVIQNGSGVNFCPLFMQVEVVE